MCLLEAFLQDKSPLKPLLGAEPMREMEEASTGRCSRGHTVRI